MADSMSDEEGTEEIVLVFASSISSNGLYRFFGLILCHGKPLLKYSSNSTCCFIRDTEDPCVARIVVREGDEVFVLAD